MVPPNIRLVQIDAEASCAPVNSCRDATDADETNGENPGIAETLRRAETVSCCAKRVRDHVNNE